MSREMRNYHIMIKQGMTWYNLESVKSETTLYFLDGMSTPARVQHPAWIFQVQTTSRSSGHGSQKSHLCRGCTFQERQHNTTS